MLISKDKKKKKKKKKGEKRKRKPFAALFFTKVTVVQIHASPKLFVPCLCYYVNIYCNKRLWDGCDCYCPILLRDPVNEGSIFCFTYVIHIILFINLLKDF